MTNRIREKRKLIFEGLPVREAKWSLHLYPIEQDKKLAKRGDPSGCVAAQAIKRAFDVEEACVYRSRVLVKPKGKNHWVRYETPYSLSTEALIFDRGGDFIGNDFILGPLKPTSTRAYKDALDKSRLGKAHTPTKKPTGTRTPSVMTKLRGTPHIHLK